MAIVGSWKNAFISVNGTALTDHTNSITVEATADEADVTTFEANGYKQMDQGLKDATITAVFHQDFGAGSVDQLLSAMFNNNAAGTVIVRPTSSTVVSGTHPQFTMVSKLFTYQPLGGAVGDVLSMEAVFRHSGTAGLQRATA